MQSSPLLHLTLGTAVCGLLAGCGSSDSSVLLTLSNLPARAKLDLAGFGEIDILSH